MILRKFPYPLYLFKVVLDYFISIDKQSPRGILLKSLHKPGRFICGFHYVLCIEGFLLFQNVYVVKFAFSSTTWNTQPL